MSGQDTMLQQYEQNTTAELKVMQLTLKYQVLNIRVWRSESCSILFVKASKIEVQLGRLEIPPCKKLMEQLPLIFV